MATTTSPKARTFAIIYGGLEGHKIATRLVRALKREGLAIAEPAKADLIIAHSGGSYLIPRSNRAQAILAINPPYWPGRGILGAMRKKVRKDLRHNIMKHPLKFISKLLWNAVYFCSDLPTNMSLWKIVHDPTRLKRIPQSAVVIRNQHDTFCSPEIVGQLNHRVVTLQGEHDDCWYHPDRYIAIIREHYDGLLD